MHKNRAGTPFRAQRHPTTGLRAHCKVIWDVHASTHVSSVLPDPARGSSSAIRAPLTSMERWQLTPVGDLPARNGIWFCFYLSMQNSSTTSSCRYAKRGWDENSDDYVADERKFVCMEIMKLINKPAQWLSGHQSTLDAQSGGKHRLSEVVVI